MTEQQAEYAISKQTVAEYQKDSLSFNRVPTWEEAEIVVNSLMRMDAAVNWWIGDAILFLEACFTEDYTQLFPEGYAAKSLANMRWVASRIQPSRRREPLSWSHHEAVASLDEQLQDELLQMAEEEGWTVKQIREAARAAQGKLPAPKQDKDAIINELRTERDTYLEALKDIAYSEQTPPVPMWVTELCERVLGEV